MLFLQVAEKEALLARQEEEKAEHRRKAKADKKGQKKSQKANRTGDKRKAEDECEDEWGEDAGMNGELFKFYNSVKCKKSVFREILGNF